MISKHQTRDFDRSYLLLACILGLAAVLRLWNLDRTSLWYDEAVSWSQSNGSLSHLITSVAADNYPPLHNLLLWLTIPILGDSETALRLPSAVAGIASIWLVYELGKMVFGRTAGLLAALLLTLSPFHIWYSTETRMYALLAALGLAFLVALTRTLQGARGCWPVLTALAGALFLYCHIYAVFSLAATGIYLLPLAATARERGLSAQQVTSLRRALVAVVCAGGLFLPWLIILVTRANDVVQNGFWIAYPDWPFLKVMARDMAGSEFLFMIFLGLSIASLIPRRVHDPSAPESSQSVALLAAFTFGPFLIAYVLSVALRPILFDRYLIAAWPGFLLLASAGACRLAPRLGPAGLIAAALTLTFQPLEFTLQQKIRPEWRKIASIYLDERQPGAPLLLYKGFAVPALRYYIRQPDGLHPVSTPQDLPNIAEDAEVWLLLAHSSEAEMNAFLNQIPEKFEETGHWRSFGWGASGLTLLRLRATGRHSG